MRTIDIIDSTLEIDESIQVFPDSPKVNILQWSNFDNHKYASEVLFSKAHMSAPHVDAPYHFQKDGITVKNSFNRLVINENIKVLKLKRR
ncbi:MAG: hypothetical protein P0116_04695 [Candidatus Nitrosocosmicus sp.]|nr:hypothetical protein [Candidatus Nitrosocosmicus sp.]